MNFLRPGLDPPLGEFERFLRESSTKGAHVTCLPPPDVVDDASDPANAPPGVRIVELAEADEFAETSLTLPGSLNELRVESDGAISKPSSSSWSRSRAIKVDAALGFEVDFNL